MDLPEYFARHPQVAVALSGGVDSAYLLWAARRYAQRVRAYTAVSEFQPAFEHRAARGLAAQLGVELTVLPLRVLDDPDIRGNPPDRCYYCKRAIFAAITAAAAADGLPLVADGTNASDDAADRPGMRALAELGVVSPLRLCGLTKAEIRRRARAAGLPCWDLPAYACLATRTPAGEELTPEKLRATEQAEAALAALGFGDLRVRAENGRARIQLPAAQLARALEKREEILEKLKPLYKSVSLDLEARG